LEISICKIKYLNKKLILHVNDDAHIGFLLVFFAFGCVCNFTSGLDMLGQYVLLLDRL
jgi:hypothetical protein